MTRGEADSNLDVSVVRLRSEALDIDQLDGVRRSGSDGKTFQLYALALGLGFSLACGVGLDSVQD